MDINIKRLKLKNGIRVIIVPLKTKLTYISTNFLLGRYQEKKDEVGLTHYCEHLLACLTSQKYKDANYISDEIYRRGGLHNATVSDYEMEIYISGLFVDLEFYMDILSNTINKFYVENDIKIKEKGAVVQELMSYISASNYKFNFNMFKFLYPKYSYIADYKKQIKYIKHFDNKKISQFIKSHLNTDNLIVTITCPSNKVNITCKNVKKYFGIIKKKRSRFVYPELINKNNHLQIVNIKNDNINESNSLILQISKRIEFLSEEHLILSYYIRRIIFNFDSGIFYKIFRKELGIIYHIGLYVNIDNYNPNMSYYNISSRCQNINMPLFIEKLIAILKTYDINDVHIKDSKKHFKYLFENAKFNNLTSYNDKYKNQLLFYKDIVKSKDILKKILSIKSSSIKDYFKNVFVKDILSNHTLFYYSNKNINKDIEMIYKKNISNTKCKTYYIP
jgi:predicted Zn-dependent peptidase